jgi:hypothetical protein
MNDADVEMELHLHVKTEGDRFLLGLVNEFIVNDEEDDYLDTLGPEELALAHARQAACEALIANPGQNYDKCQFSKFMHEKPAAVHVRPGLKPVVLENFYGKSLTNEPLVFPVLDPCQIPWQRLELWPPGAPPPWESTETLREYEWRLETLLSNHEIYTHVEGHVIDPRADMRKATEMVPDKRRRRF